MSAAKCTGCFTHARKRRADDLDSLGFGSVVPFVRNSSSLPQPSPATSACCCTPGIQYSVRRQMFAKTTGNSSIGIIHRRIHSLFLHAQSHSGDAAKCVGVKVEQKHWIVVNRHKKCIHKWMWFLAVAEAVNKNKYQVIRLKPRDLKWRWSPKFSELTNVFQEFVIKFGN